MDKKKTSVKQKTLLKSTAENTTLKLKKKAKVIEYNPMKELLDENLIGLAVWECLKNNDPEEAIKIIEIYLYSSHYHQANNKPTTPLL